MGVLVYAHIALAVVAIPLAVIDLWEHRLPDRLTLPLWGFSAVAALSQLGLAGSQDRVLDAVMASALVVSLLWCAAEAPGRPLGFGDVKLGGARSLQLGWYGIDFALWGLALSVFFGGIWSLWGLIRRYFGPRDAIAFGPWLLMGAIVALMGVSEAGNL